HLERPVAFVFDYVIEAPGRRNASVGIQEANSGLTDKVLFHLGQHAQIFEQPVAKGQKRLADMFARKLRFLEKQNVMPRTGKQTGCRGPRGASSNDYDFASFFCHICSISTWNRFDFADKIQFSGRYDLFSSIGKSQGYRRRFTPEDCWYQYSVP